MNQFLQQLVNGLSIGSVYALIALGYTMVYGIIKLINFAHGEIYMLGAYFGYVLMTYLGLGFIESLLISMALAALLGVVIEKVAYKPLRNSTRIASLITAIGVSILLQNVTARIFGPSVKTYPNTLTNASFEIGGVHFTQSQIMIFVVTIVLMVALNLVVQKTKIGRAMRAVSTDLEASQLMGVNTNRIISFTFAIGSALASAGGILVGFHYNSINPTMGVAPGLKAFIAAVFGGIGIIPGAMIGGFFIGIVETMVAGYGSSLYKDAVVYGILILILIIKPTGLLGKNSKEKV